MNREPRARSASIALALLVLLLFGCHRTTEVRIETRRAFSDPPADAYPAFFAGVVVPMLTAYDAADVTRLDLETQQQFTDWLCRSEATALFCCSGMGQWDRLSVAEKKDVIRTVVEAAAGRKAVLAGVGSPASTADTIEVARYAEEIGADALSVVTPSFLRPEGGRLDQQALFDYYDEVARAVTLPILVYDARAEFAPDTMIRLHAAHPHVQAMKYRTDNATDMIKMCAAVGDRVAVLSGIEYNTLTTLAAGGVGVIGGGPNLFPNLVARILTRWRAGDIVGARQAQREVIEAHAKADLLRHPSAFKVLLAELCEVPFAPNNRGGPVDPPPPDAAALAAAKAYFRARGANPQHRFGADAPEPAAPDAPAAGGATTGGTLDAPPPAAE